MQDTSRVMTQMKRDILVLQAGGAGEAKYLSPKRNKERKQRRQGPPRAVEPITMILFVSQQLQMQCLHKTLH